MERKQRISPQTAAVLRALADQGSGWSHGYELCSRLGLKAGTLYPILMRLADRDQVEAVWEDVVPQGRPPRHLYRLSRAGAELVRQLPAEPTTPSGDAVAPGRRRRRIVIGAAEA